jgi:polyisoprenoid-binding protein YceI
MSRNFLKPVEWNLDAAHSFIQFKVRHLLISTVSGTFTTFRARVVSEVLDLTEIQVHFEADVASITTGNADRDKHLLSEDFFFAEKYPVLQFEATKTTRGDENTFLLHGDLNIRGVSRPFDVAVCLNGIAEDPYGQTKAGLSLSGRFNRKDFGLNFHVLNKAGDRLVDDEVRIEAEVQLIRQAD